MEEFASYPPPFLVDGRLVQPDLNRVTGPGGPVRVEPRVMQVLLVLARRPQTVIPREQILDEVWSDQIVGEENLTRAVSELRRIFGDDSRRPRVIETIRNHGYRLICEVGPAGAEAGRDTVRPVGEPVPEPLRGREGKLPRPRWLWLPAAILVAGLVWLAMHRTVSPSSSPVAEAPPWESPVPLTAYRGRERHPALSPDGTRVAFIWAGDGLPAGCLNALYIKQRNLEEPLLLSAAPGWAAWPAWSPDGQTVAFVQGGGEGVALCTVASLGGGVRELYRSRDLIEGVDWMNDGGSLVFSALDSVSGARRLMTVDVGSLDVRVLDVSSSGEDFQPRCRPGGGDLAWVHRDPGGSFSLWTGRPEENSSRLLAGKMGALGGLAWISGGEGLVFSAAEGGAVRLWTVDAAGGRARMLDTGPQPALNPTISRVTGDLAFEQVTMDRDLVLIRVVARDPWRLRSSSLASSTRWEYGADFSPDGQQVALISARSGFPEIWRGVADGSELIKLTDFRGPALTNLRWSPSGDELAFQVNTDGHNKIMVIAAAGGRAQPVDIAGEEMVLSGWTPQGRCLLVARRGTGGWLLFRVEVQGVGESPGKADVLMDIPATTGAISPVDQSLYFTRPRRPGLWRLEQGQDDPTLIVSDLSPGDQANWRLLDGHVAWVDRVAGAPYLMWMDLDDRESSMVADLPGLTDGGIAVAPGGKAFIYPRGVVVTSDLMVMAQKRPAP